MGVLFVFIKHHKICRPSVGGFCIGCDNMSKAKKKENAEDNKFLEEWKRHKCYLCPWGMLTGNKVMCVRVKCVRDEHT